MICRFNKITHTHYKHVVIKICRYSGIHNEGASFATSGHPSDYQNIPSPKGLPVIGTSLAIIAAGGAPHLHIYADRRHKQLGPIFSDKIGPVSAIFLSDPELMRAVFTQEGKYPVHILPEAWTLYNKFYGCKRGLFFMNGAEWLHYRRIMNKHLLKGDFTWIEESCRIVSKDLVANWKVLISQNKILPNLEERLYRWSLNTFVAVLLGRNAYNEHKNELDDLLEYLSSTVHRIFETSVKFQIFPATLAHKFKFKSWDRFVKSVDDAMKLANELVNRLNEIPGGDGLLARMKSENLPKSDITRIVVDLVLAAGDTTAYTMSWMLYLIARHKDIQDNLRRNPSAINLKNVIRECLRLYPTAIFLTRILPQDSIIGGYKIPEGTLMLFSMYTSGRNSKYFENPNKFLPDRWLRENSTSNMQQVCIPFGFGARSCIGRKIAENQLQCLLMDVINSFDLELENNKEIELVLKMVAVPSEPIRLKLNPI
ncbi:hypothetical protein ILUMI_07202 [Ignelater luminosus]|uniref:Cytochrome P450 n=1 Tax=Ignelater luminosus TaxID=2038154 RepID=A0A8K0DDZ5_IGNLU|nr:hypothetical protein ILUMI_07202 [Ignelater luminosus]